MRPLIANSFDDLNFPSPRDWVADDVYGVAWPQVLTFSGAVLGLLLVGLIIRSLRGG